MTPDGRASRRSVLFIQGYVPVYRRAFFEGLRGELATADIDLRVAIPQLSDDSNSRGDETTIDGLLATPGRAWNRKLKFGQISNYGSAPLLRDYNAVVVPAAATLLDFHWAIFGPGRAARKVGAFGHIGAYVKAPNPVDRWMEARMLRRCDRVFAYTASGGQEAVGMGISPQRVTVVHNTIDTVELQRAIADVSLSDIAHFKKSHRVDSHDTVYGYLGALDHDKSIAKLAEILDLLYISGSTNKMIIAGQGPARYLLKAAEMRGQVSLIGYADARAKALMAATCAALINPGRIGLVAVDALTMRLPLVTTTGAAHAPEAEYLLEGQSLLTGPGDPREFVPWLTAQRIPQLRNTTPPLMRDMIRHFAGGIHDLLDSE